MVSMSTPKYFHMVHFTVDTLNSISHSFIRFPSFYLLFLYSIPSITPPLKHAIHFISTDNKRQQEYIPVGCVPPACWPYPNMHWAGGCISACTGQGVYPRMHWGCIPACTGQGGICPGGGVCPRGWGCGRHPPWDKRQTPTPPPPSRWTDRHLWKRNLRNLRLRAVKICCTSNFGLNSMVPHVRFYTKSGLVIWHCHEYTFDN